MKSQVRAIVGAMKGLIGSDRVCVDGSILPAKHLRTGGIHFQEDAAYLASAEEEAKRLQEHLDLNEESALLDIGCSTGRLAIGIQRTIGNVTYRGVDVSETSIRWAKRNIQKHHPTFRFLHLNIKNERYNPQGSMEEHLLPFESQSFDIIYLYSVFSHMKEEHVVEYLREFSRLLRNGGRIFLTVFVEEDVEAFTENPKGYKQEWKGALHCVRFEKAHFESLLAEHQLIVEKCSYGTETDGQSAYILSAQS